MTNKNVVALLILFCTICSYSYSQDCIPLGDPITIDIGTTTPSMEECTKEAVAFLYQGAQCVLYVRQLSIYNSYTGKYELVDQPVYGVTWEVWDGLGHYEYINTATTQYYLTGSGFCGACPAKTTYDKRKGDCKGYYLMNSGKLDCRAAGVQM